MQCPVALTAAPDNDGSRHGPSGSSTLQVAVCIAGQSRTIVSTARFIERAMIQPIRNESDVYMALSNSTITKLRSEDLVYLRSIFAPVTLRLFHSKWQTSGLVQCIKDISLTEAKVSPNNTSSCFIHNQEKGCRYEWVLRLRPDVVYGKMLPPYELWPHWSLAHPVVFTGPETGRSRHFSTRDQWLVKDTWALVTPGARHAYFSDWSRLGIGRSAKKDCGWSIYMSAEGDLACTLLKANVYVVALQFPYFIVRETIGGHAGGPRKIMYTGGRMKDKLDAWELLPEDICHRINQSADAEGHLEQIRWDGHRLCPFNMSDEALLDFSHWIPFVSSTCQPVSHNSSV